MGEITARAVTIIDVVDGDDVLDQVIFETRDIGCTQGTTLSVECDSVAQVVAQYRPGTRHEHRALEIALRLVAKAAVTLRRDCGRPLWDEGEWRQHLAAAMEGAHCVPWDGDDPWVGDYGRTDPPGGRDRNA